MNVITPGEIANRLTSSRVDLKGNPMRKGGRVLILLGVVLALAAAVLAIFAFRDTDGDDVAADPDEVMVSVVEATRDIPSNHVITEDDVQVVEVEEGTVAPNTARTTGQVLGLATAGDVVSGQRVLMANLSTPGLSHIVNEGMRAVAVPIDRVNALGGMIRADDRIDIVYSTRVMLQHVLPSEPWEVIDTTEGFAEEDTLVVAPPGEAGQRYPFPGESGSRFLVQDLQDGEPITKVVLQNIRVARVVAGDMTVEDDPAAQVPDEDAQEDDESDTDDAEPGDDARRLPGADLLILEVDAQQAELIKFFLDNEGRFQVALRATNDEEVVETSGMTYHQLVEDLGMPVPRTVRLPEDD